MGKFCVLMPITRVEAEKILSQLRLDPQPELREWCDRLAMEIARMETS